MSAADDQYTVLSRAVQKNDRQALASLIDLKRPQLLAFIQRNMSDRLQRKVDAGDILQETAVRALESLGTFELGERDPFSWLCQVAERRIVDAHRKHFATQKRAGEREQSLNRHVGPGESQEFINLLVSSMTTPSAAFSRDQREGLLLQAIEQLPETAREALRLRYIEGLPTKEIAERLGKSDGAVRVTLTRTLRQLETTLAENSWFRPGTDSD